MACAKNAATQWARFISARFAAHGAGACGRSHAFTRRPDGQFEAYLNALSAAFHRFCYQINIPYVRTDFSAFCPRKLPTTSAMAFVSALPVTGRATNVALSRSSFASVRIARALPARRPAVIVARADEDRSIPQGFTFFSETLNGRAAMVGFMLALVTEAITGKGIVGQVASVFDIVKEASALIH